MEPPPLVTRALEFAEARGIGRPGQGENGPLLHVLAARRGITRAAEIGAGSGVGAAWIVSALLPATPFFTAQADPEYAAAIATFYADDPNVAVLTGSWRGTLPPEAPFDLLFVAAGDAKDDVDAAIGLLAPGGTAVLDDFRPDPAFTDLGRDAWLEHPLLTAVELWVTPRRRALVAVRR
jgi:predicted O-methyltransferase YrrM